jgi:hypothetical protein
MPTDEATRRIHIVSACMRADGLPYLALTSVEVTTEQIENAVHYYLAEADLLEAGYEEPFVHFAEDEAPSFLLPAVRDYLARGLHAASLPRAATCPAWCDLAGNP